MQKITINSRAQVPGYQGYIPGKISQNKFGATFAQVSTGSYPTHPQSFLTTNIANNSFIQQQHTQDNVFWGNSGKVSGFCQHNKKPQIRIQRVPIQKFVPHQETQMTYQQAVDKRL